MRYRMTDNELRNGQPGTLGLIAGYGYDYDSIGNVTHLRDKKEEDDYQRRFTYDELNRLLRASTKADTPGHPSPLWGEAEYSWDAMGNILRASLAEVEPGGPDNLARTNPKRFQPPNKPIKRSPNTIVQPLGRVMSFTYEGTTPVMTAITLNDLERPVTHDAAGNELKYVVTRSYSPRNLLREVIDDSDPGELWPHEVAYGYDGRGVRVVRAENPSNGGGTVARRSYVYTPELQLLSVTREDGMNVWGGNPPSSFGNNVDEEIVWFGSRPVAQIAPAGATRYTFADHLGTPLLQTDGTSTIIWRVEYEPFGNVFIVREGTRTDQPLRFPGQELAMTWEGPEENYNIFRWYKSSSGRYTQADPVNVGSLVYLPADGLSLDRAMELKASYLMWPQRQNAFGYVGGDPQDNIDPTGQFSLDCARRQAPPALAKAQQYALTPHFPGGRRGLHNGPADAFRHCYWSCLMVENCGWTTAAAAGSGHEIYDNGFFPNPSGERNMDLENNAQGRDCAGDKCRGCDGCCLKKLFMHELQEHP